MPGVRSARWAGPGARPTRPTTRCCCAQLDDVPTSRARRAVRLRHGSGAARRHRARPARRDGGAAAARAPRVTNGFGYDPLFVADGKSRSNGRAEPGRQGRDQPPRSGDPGDRLRRSWPRSARLTRRPTAGRPRRAADVAERTRMKTYLDLLDHVLTTGVRKADRTGTGTLSVFGYQMRFDLADGLPAAHHQEVHTRSMIAELLWFLRGSTNVALAARAGRHDLGRVGRRRGRTRARSTATSGAPGRPRRASTSTRSPG